MPIKEEDERFHAGGHEYTIRTAFSGDSGIWYEILLDGQLVGGTREPWPVHLGGRPYTKGELIAEKQAMLDQAKRRQEASGEDCHHSDGMPEWFVTGLSCAPGILRAGSCGYLPVAGQYISGRRFGYRAEQGKPCG